MTLAARPGRPGLRPGRRQHRGHRERRPAQRQRRHAGGPPRGGAGAARLVIAGGTAGVLDGRRAPSPRSTREAMDAMIASGTAHSGMIAKLAACRRALEAGVARGPSSRHPGLRSRGTRLTRGSSAARLPSVAQRPVASQVSERADHDDHDAPLDEIGARVAPPAPDLQARSPWPSSVEMGCLPVRRRGRSYLDFCRASGVASLGHAHRSSPRRWPRRRNAGAHLQPVLPPAPGTRWPARLAALSGLPRAFFCNSGTEAVEACLKFARRYWHARGRRRPHGVRRARARLSRPDVRVAVGDVGRALPRPVRAARAGRHLRAGRRSGRARRP
jgi:hypothetical protein